MLKARYFVFVVAAASGCGTDTGQGDMATAIDSSVARDIKMQSGLDGMVPDMVMAPDLATAIDAGTDDAMIDAGGGDATTDDGGAIDATTADAVDAGPLCNAQSCPNGCCSGNACTKPSAQACGGNGAACVACDPKLADSCVSGACQCGMGALCANGQRCLNGTCTCDGQSCPNGCCNGNTCMPSAFGNCGIGGNSCIVCDPNLASVCTNGVCSCGMGGACANGQRCANGACACDGMSCPNGCCAGKTCSAPSAMACGTAGAMCVACDPMTTDSCVAGACKCGMNAPCANGQQCVNGACVCNAASCPSGCCANNACQAGNQNAVCGTGGAACANCGNSQCVNGVCQGCAMTCKTGCCAGNVCVSPPTQQQCGANAGACMACDPTLTDSCV